MASGSSDELPEYEIRLTEVAEMEVDAVYLGRMKFGPEHAERWHAGLLRVPAYS